MEMKWLGPESRSWEGILHDSCLGWTAWEAGTPVARPEVDFMPRKVEKRGSVFLLILSVLRPRRRAVAGHTWEERISFLFMFSSQSSETRHSSLLWWWCNSRNDLYFSCAVKSLIPTSVDHRVQVTSYLELRWWGPSVEVTEMSPEVGHPTAGWSQSLALACLQLL